MFEEINTKTCKFVIVTNWVKYCLKNIFISIFHKYKFKLGTNLIYIKVVSSITCSQFENLNEL